MPGYPVRHGIKHSDFINSYFAMACIGKNDFEAINTIESDYYFQSAMDIETVSSEAKLRQRQRLGNRAGRYVPIVAKLSRGFMVNIQLTFAPLSSGRVSFGADVAPLDNTGSHKECGSRTYKGCYGYAPMVVYLGQEGYDLDVELREGKQHCQKDAPALLEKALDHTRRITTQPLLLILDGGNDAIENIDRVLNYKRTPGQLSGGGGDSSTASLFHKASAKAPL